METLRHCRRCQTDKPEEAFRRLRTTGRFQPYCKPCVLAYAAERRRASPTAAREKAREADQRRRATKGPEMKAYQAAYRAAHREELRQGAVLYRQRLGDDLRAKNRERTKTEAYRTQARAYRQQRAATDPEFRARLAAYGKKAAKRWYAKHRQSILATLRERYWADPERARENVRRLCARWRAAHPETLAAINAQRKALHRGAIVAGFDEVAHYRHLEQWQQGRCYHCDGPLGAYHRDHVVPVVAGGKHEAGNLVLSCAYCNGSKHSKLLWRDWRPPLTFGAPVLLESVPVPVVSTFAASERGSAQPRAVLERLRVQHPAAPLIFDWEWARRRSAVKNMLAARGGTAENVVARKTTVVEIDSDVARGFLDEHHLQGFGRGTLYLGLAHGEDLVGVSAWLELDGAIELNRLAFKGRVQGGFGKMVETFRRHFLPTGMPVVSFLDPRYGDGHGYEKVGFEAAGETAAPVYYYVGPDGIFHRRLFNKNAMQRRLTFFDAALPEHEIARVNGYYRLFGFKQRRYILKT